MKILPIKSKPSPENNLERTYRELAQDARSSASVLHQSLVECAVHIRQMKAIGDNAARALDAAENWAAQEGAAFGSLDLSLVDPDHVEEGGKLLDRNAVSEALRIASAAAADCSLGSGSRKRLELLHKHYPTFHEAISLCRRGYVDRMESDAYPRLACRSLRVTGRAMDGTPPAAVAAFTSKALDVYSAALGSTIDEPMKQKIFELEHTLGAASTIIDRAMEAAGLAAAAEAELLALERDDDADTEPAF